MGFASGQWFGVAKPEPEPESEIRGHALADLTQSFDRDHLLTSRNVKLRGIGLAVIYLADTIREVGHEVLDEYKNRHA